MMHRRTFIVSAVGLVGAGLLAGAAQAEVAQSKAVVESAKAAGLVGELADGMLGFVKGGADAALKAAVDEINAGRAQVYREAAARNGVTPAAAGGSAFQTVILGKLKPGEYYRPEGGAWTRK
jgi:uncharacterized protein YdbL (DUF1318 family)